MLFFPNGDPMEMGLVPPSLRYLAALDHHRVGEIYFRTMSLPLIFHGNDDAGDEERFRRAVMMAAVPHRLGYYKPHNN